MRWLLDSAVGLLICLVVVSSENKKYGKCFKFNISATVLLLILSCVCSKLASRYCIAPL